MSYPDASFGKESRIGVPFIFMLREILQFDASLDAAIHRMKTKRRTCDLILGVGDGKESTVRGFQYSYSQLNVLSDTNFLPVNASWHAPIADAVYWGMDWICPTFNKVNWANVFFFLFSEFLVGSGRSDSQVLRQNYSPDCNAANHSSHNDWRQPRCVVRFDQRCPLGGFRRSRGLWRSQGELLAPVLAGRRACSCRRNQKLK